MATTTERGYGAPHQQERKRWEPAVNAGRETCRETYCFYPSRLIEPGMKWELAHDHESPTTRYKGPAHQVCNRMEELIRSGKMPAPAPRRLAL
jgi:hypothetical protein